tara:strand:+ start:57 stop:1064 length:1008 start_codon:yes stop_codon:yes gene_type:complete
MENIKKILVIRFSSIGDIVLTTSFLNSVRQLHDSVEIHYLTLEKFSSILELQPDIDRLIILNGNSNAKDLFKMNEYIQLSKYDKIYDLHGSIRSRIITFGLNKITTRVKKPRFLRFMLFQFHINMFPKNYSSVIMYHQCLQDYDFLEIPKTYLQLSSQEKRAAQSTLENLGIEEDFIVLVPGAAWPQKQWQVDKYNHAINNIMDETDKKIVMLGSKDDIICKSISKVNANVIDYSGKTNLREAMAIISISNTVFGSDTGLLHIAESLGKKISMILGPTSKETGGGVSNSDSVNIESEIWCRPCSQNGKSECYRSIQYCMDGIPINKVVKSVVERV